MKKGDGDHREENRVEGRQRKMCIRDRGVRQVTDCGGGSMARMLF